MKKISLIVLLILLVIGGRFFLLPKIKEEKNLPQLINKITNPEEKNVTEKNEVVEAWLKKLTLKEKVEQLFFVPYNDSTASASYGGIIFFAQDFADQDETSVKKMMAQLQKTAKVPLLLGVDEEGGIVNRVSKNKKLRASEFVSAQNLLKQKNLNAVAVDTESKARFLKNLGLNVNFAPVADISLNEKDYIYQRTAGKEAGETSAYVKSVIQTMKEEKIGSVLKHFPGYGNNEDTHRKLVNDQRSRDFFFTHEFLPFQAGIESGADAILVSHVIVNNFDASAPASLSPKIHQILRNELNFAGVTITDDLQMQAIRQFNHGEISETVIQALSAGNDMVCMAGSEELTAKIMTAITAGRLDEEAINNSVRRILQWKENLGILEKKESQQTAAAPLETNLLSTGDLMLGRSVNYLGAKKADFAWSLKNVRAFLKNFDLTIANLETPIIKNCPLTNEGMIFCADEKSGQALKNAEIELVTLANNHLSNYGETGRQETKAILQTAGIMNVSENEFLEKEIKGEKFGFLAFDDVSAKIEETNFSQLIKEKSQLVDHLIVALHFGVEYNYQPTDRQKKLAKMAIDSGAEIILGNHSHWVGPIEIYKNGVIIYSHGNFVFDQMWAEETRSGIVAAWQFSNKKLAQITISPIWITDYGLANFAEGEKANKILQTVQTISNGLGTRENNSLVIKFKN